MITHGYHFILSLTNQMWIFKKEAIPSIASEVDTTFRVKNIQGTYAQNGLLIIASSEERLHCANII